MVVAGVLNLVEANEGKENWEVENRYRREHEQTWGQEMAWYVQEPKSSSEHLECEENHREEMESNIQDHDKFYII